MGTGTAVAFRTARTPWLVPPSGFRATDGPRFRSASIARAALPRRVARWTPEMPDPPPPLAHSILDAMGNTPLVELRHAVAARGLNGRVLAKLESLNPGSSKKDRVALEIVREARADGSLRDGQAVVELTSGNTGAGLAIVCRALGHPFVAVISRGNSVERVRQIRALGAEVVLVDQAPGSAPGRVSGA